MPSPIRYYTYESMGWEVLEPYVLSDFDRFLLRSCGISPA